MSEDCKPKIIRYYLDYHDYNFDYNCEMCNNELCVHWKEFNEVENDN